MVPSSVNLFLEFTCCVQQHPKKAKVFVLLSTFHESWKMAHHASCGLEHEVGHEDLENLILGPVFRDAS